MDILVSAVVGDLISRSASFVISNYFQHKPDINKIVQRLHTIILRIDIIVEEGEGRHITNQGMLRQLKTLRQGMYRGHYVLDATRFQAALDKEGILEATHSTLALSKSRPAKRLRISWTGSGNSNKEAPLFGTDVNRREELQRMVDTLEGIVDGMKEFLFFIDLYPRILHQPYGTYLILDNCMFGRQTEREQVLNFLLRPNPTPDLDVLPIIGPIRVGKSTLVEYICRDESVRDHFSMILFFTEGSLKDEQVVELKESNINGLVRHQNCACQKRLLIIVDVAEDISEDMWRRLKSSANCMTPYGGSKIIITSRSDRILNLGTTEALRLDYLPQEAYWHFFKSLVFRSTDPDEQPKLAVLAMRIALEQKQCFTSAHMTAGLLRDNFNARFWQTYLEGLRACEGTHLLTSDKHPFLCLRGDEPLYFWSLDKSHKRFLLCNYHQSGSSENVPEISVRDIILGCVGTVPSGEFEVLSWSSRIPPYFNYMISIKMQPPELALGWKKRVHREENLLI